MNSGPKKGSFNVVKKFQRQKDIDASNPETNMVPKSHDNEANFLVHIMWEKMSLFLIVVLLVNEVPIHKEHFVGKLVSLERALR